MLCSHRLLWTSSRRTVAFNQSKILYDLLDGGDFPRHLLLSGGIALPIFQGLLYNHIWISCLSA